MKTTNKLVAEICLYGNNEIGFDFLAHGQGVALFGMTKELHTAPGGTRLRFETTSQAIWAAQEGLRGLRGEVAIHAPGGEMHAVARVGSIPSAGSLGWVRTESRAA